MTRKTIVFFGIVLVLLAVLGVGVLAQDMPVCEGDYLESVRDLGTIYVRALNEGSLDSWYAVLADDYVAYYGDAGFMPMDKDAARASDEVLFVLFPGFQTEIHFTTVSADCRSVTFHWTSSGTYVDTGLSGAVSGLSVVEVADGKILSEWVAYDQLTLFNAVGIMGPNAPAPGGLTAAIAEDFVVRFDAVINEDTALARELFHEDFTATLPFGAGMDREGWIAYAELFKASFPDIVQTTNFMFHSGDKLVIHVTYHATFSGAPFFGAEATGDPIVMNGIGIFRFEDGMPIENLAVLDVGELFVQTGVVVPPAQ